MLNKKLPVTNTKANLTQLNNDDNVILLLNEILI